MAPLRLCHTEKIAPGTVDIGYIAKWTVAKELASPEFCIPTSIEIAEHLSWLSRNTLPTT